MLNSTWDRVGALISGACLVHCLSLPLLLTVSPWIGQKLDAPAFHQAVVVLAVPVAFLAFLPGYRRHRKPQVLCLGFGGAALLLCAALLGHTWLESNEHLCTILGGCCLIAAHILNFRYSASCCAHDGC